ncbi:MAG: outer membrane lipoprotein LolB [Endozoicomonadaceae bacterium]|nr:outer membrane lipoprotein LolB [Endozoicomonadaceae bacterium]
MQYIHCSVSYLVGTLLLLILTSCVSHTQRSPENESRSWQQHESNISALTQWQISGKLGVRSESSTGGSATLEWEENDDHYTIYLTGPFGRSMASIWGMPGSVSMIVPNQATLTDSSLENMIYRHTGWVVPFNMLQYWVKGMPAPGEYDDLQLNAYNRLMSLSQRGWDIMFDRYSVASDHDMPGRLRLHKGNTRVTLLIQSWSLFS